jgi:hypothetical protein
MVAMKLLPVVADRIVYWLLMVLPVCVNRACPQQGWMAGSPSGNPLAYLLDNHLKEH